MHTALIVDDEGPARRRLRALLAARAGWTAVAEARTGLEAVDAIREMRPELVLLDIQIPGLDGFEVIRTIGAEAMPAVVFVTAYDVHAVDAFRVEAVDFLVKPVDAARFEQALARVERRLGASRAQDASSLDRLLDAVRPGRAALERLVVRDGGRVVFVPVAEIERLVSAGNYVEVFVEGGRSFLLRDTLARVESQLDPARFVRVHRTVIAAVAAVREVVPAQHGDAILHLESGATIRMSRRYAKTFPAR
jgi:two-component system LytT family response regulator